jgi:hypothetical protein
MYTIITGMSKTYYDNIGKSMLESWLKFWPRNFNLLIYSEDELSFLNSSNVRYVDLNSLGEPYIKFQKEDYKKLNSRIKTFGKKAFPIMKNLESNQGKLIWIDADVITLNCITIEWLDSLLPKNFFSCHLGVPQNEYYSVETGFFIIDLENKHKTEFLERYKNIYYNKDFSNMKKPYDGDTFGRIITEMKKITDFKYNDLSSKLEERSPFDRVFRNKMTHLKAKKKKR